MQRGMNAQILANEGSNELINGWTNGCLHG